MFTNVIQMLIKLLWFVLFLLKLNLFAADLKFKLSQEKNLREMAEQKLNDCEKQKGINIRYFSSSRFVMA